MSKAAAKSAKTDAGKAAKKRPDPEGLKLIEQGDAAMAEKDFAKAIQLFNETPFGSRTIEVRPDQFQGR